MKKLGLLTVLVSLFTLNINAQVFFKVSGNGLKSDSYLFGTHHIAPLKTFTDNEAAKSAFESSQIVVGEIDLTVGQMQLAAAMQPYMMAPADSTLSKVLTADQIKMVDDTIAKYLSPQINTKMFDPLKPMVVVQNLTVIITAQSMPDFNPTEQLDTYFMTQGKATGKQIKALETAEQQAELLFNTHSIAEQAETLMETVSEPAKLTEETKQLNEAYLNQDMEKLFEISKMAEDDPEFFEKLLINRNNDWMTKLPEIMQEGSSFIAVGCLHLVGEYGLVEQLRNAGYNVEPIQ